VNGIETGVNTQVFTSPGLTTGSVISVTAKFTTTCGTVSEINSNLLSVISIPVPNISIATALNSVCNGASTLFVSSVINEGASPTFKWFINNQVVGGNTRSLNTPLLTNNAQVRAELTSSAACADPSTVLSNILTMTVRPNTNSSIVISGNTVNTVGQSTILTSTSANPGGNPGYSWQDSTQNHSWQAITGTNTPSITYTPGAAGIKIRCLLYTSADCPLQNPVTSNTLTFTTNPVTAINPVPGSTFGIRNYPNPVQNILYIDSLKISDRWTKLVIISSSGSITGIPVSITGRTSVTLNLTSLTSGYYLLKLKRNTGPEAVIRFIKQ